MFSDTVSDIAGNVTTKLYYNYVNLFQTLLIAKYIEIGIRKYIMHVSSMSCSCKLPKLSKPFHIFIEITIEHTLGECDCLNYIIILSPKDNL